MRKKVEHQDDERLIGALTQETGALETTIREMLGRTDRHGGLMLAIIGGSAAFVSQTGSGALGATTLSAALLTLVVMIHLNATLEAASLGELRDTLAWRANELLGENVFLTGRLGKQRRASFTSLASNALVVAIILGAWTWSIMLAVHTRWLVAVIVGTAISCTVLFGGAFELTRTTQDVRRVLRAERPNDRAW